MIQARRIGSLLSFLLAAALMSCGSTDASSSSSGGGQGGGGQGGSTSGTAGGGSANADSEFALHVVDVGTGLGIFVQGPGFTLVFDAGSDDDSATGSASNRFVDYLKAIRPDLERIDHVILSHPHQDHVDLLPGVLAEYAVGDVWDSGATSDLCAYQAFIVGVESKNSVTQYHSAANDEGLHDVVLPQPCVDMGSVVTDDPNQRSSVELQHGDRITPGLAVELGSQASMKFLYANGETEEDPNLNSLVVRIKIGDRRILLLGDANDVAASTGIPSIEEVLLQEPEELASDVLVAGYHGWTGAESGFIEAVGPAISIVSSAPLYADPDPDVLAALEETGEVFRADADDDSCPSESEKVGSTADGKLGGCSNVKVTIKGESLVAGYLSSVE